MKTYDEFTDDAADLLIKALRGTDIDINTIEILLNSLAGALRGAYTDGINQAIIEQTKRLHRGGL